MARVEESVHVEADPQRVWDVLADWESQPLWMADAQSVTVLSAHREGSGVVLRCRTNILGGVVVTDDVATTEWEPPRVLGVHHLGPWYRGAGAFELEPTPHGTHVRWWEEVEAPLGRLGEAVATLLMPWVARVFRRSLAELKGVCEAPA